MTSDSRVTSSSTRRTIQPIAAPTPDANIDGVALARQARTELEHRSA
jgi:hypothetical protein